MAAKVQLHRQVTCHNSTPMGGAGGHSQQLQQHPQHTAHGCQCRSKQHSGPCQAIRTQPSRRHANGAAWDHRMHHSVSRSGGNRAPAASAAAHASGSAPRAHASHASHAARSSPAISCACNTDTTAAPSAGDAPPQLPPLQLLLSSDEDASSSAAARRGGSMAHRTSSWGSCMRPDRPCTSVSAARATASPSAAPALAGAAASNASAWRHVCTA
eukprot:366029-Chlamydomonas_euryale.AAC.18